MRRLLALLLLAAAPLVHAGEVSVAVAANFTSALQEIAVAFERDTGHKVVAAFGSTGRFYAQIRNGAPYQVLLAADDETPARLEQDGATVAGTRFTYAVGRLVLWSTHPNMIDARGEVLKLPGGDKVAIADPKLAPYGAAAIQVMQRLGVLDSLRPRLVQGDSIAQTYQFVSTGNAPIGFVALSQVMSGGRVTSGSWWVVPEALHEPLKQDAVLLARGQGNPAAIALLAYLRGSEARAIIRAHGYGL
ncbi:MULTISPECIES: molybdate ABC transporter substrate-binding protein [Ramlibacter]|uniref:Molybdate ABC transporter substrate-binding protein n=1 Tax=Ramlibacter pinisoli TaxID=2682844 RepID=A0A6N8ISW6_9BURK|nr:MULTISPECIES: molybdate ABC transporter substrate-binding protein [Ramlibacter]MBA2963997.1 molybdate ABC transporter substrate-binding protein [Ramlibacter sp. CGMCC 1.13660]MVQ28963.1 molybdate ABC transporter substrate-binding protein [Ramlibacter pinisoli]